jgi:hypothetical protein
LGEYLEYEIDIRESIKLIANNERYVFWNCLKIGTWT